MTADARSLAGAVPDTFDFDSQAGILFVLRAIRAAEISSEDKNALKDLVFLYNTGGKDESVKKKLADALQVKDVTPQAVVLELQKAAAAAALKNASPTTPGFMGGRLTPVFHPPVTAAPVPMKAAAPVAPVQKVAPVPAPKVVPDIPAPVSVPVVEKVASVAPQPRPSVPVPEPEPEPIAATPVVTPEPNNIEVVKKVEAQAASALPVDATPEYVSARMERIRVIKSDINARVGNPVNLVDVDNALGREYMGALLEAMKLLSSASEQESSIAMNRLEGVYTKVLALLDSQKKVEVSVAPATPVTPVTPEAPVVSVPIEPVVMPVVPVPEPVIEQPAPEVVAPVSIPVVPIPVPPPVAPVVADPVTPPVAAPALDVIVRSKVSDKPSVEPVASNWDTATHAPVDVVPSVGVAVMPSDVVTVNRMSTPPAEPLRPVVAPVAQVYQPEVTSSVSEVKPLRAITELPTADEVSAVEAMGSNPLYTKDVDAGLDQLLSEWAIFKKSGLFGTGPKGREHPLYVKIAPMQVPLILSGRFEGSTQEIKQSITDYMNGWRYEQGIIYEANETFDQYLRRVIRHIIDLQKTKRRS